MSTTPSQFTIELRPRHRVEVIDLFRQMSDRHRDALRRYPYAIYSSPHTTAGFLEQSLCARLHHDPDSLEGFVGAFQNLFPPAADYRHDQMHLRAELSEAQREIEPPNGDSHLTYIGSGLKNVVAYQTDTPAFFIDLDGVNITTAAPRRREATVIGFNREERVTRLSFDVPVSGHAIDSINVKDPRLGIYDEVHDALRRHGIAKGRVDVTLASDERCAGLTVNEYETLLMQHDLAEVVRNPLRFVAEKGRNMVIDPMSIPEKTMNYAKYDFVQVVNKTMDLLGLTDTPVERLVERFMAMPAQRFLRMKRSVSLLVTDEGNGGTGHIHHGQYQSPILVQWDRSASQRRRIEVTLSRFI